jgi:hypothetical protein
LEAQKQLEQKRLDAGISAHVPDHVLDPVCGSGTITAAAGDCLRENTLSEMPAFFAPDFSDKYADIEARFSIESDSKGELPAIIAESGDGALVTTVAMLPDIGIQAIRATGTAGALSRFIQCRHLDQQGNGWVAITSLVEYAGINGASARKKLRRAINAGMGIFWTEDNQGRLWLASPKEIAKRLGISRFSAHAVDFPVAYANGSIQQFKAQLFGAWLKSHDKPITQATIRELTGIPERTQREYCKIAGIDLQRHLVVGEAWQDGVGRENRVMEQGQGAFKFVDTKGLQGQAGGEYVAWHLPNTHTSKLVKRSRTMRKRNNRHIQNLSIKKDMGNCGQDSIVKVFHETVQNAGKAWNRNSANDAYYPTGLSGGEYVFMGGLLKQR